jgi:hypothetical protein
MGSKSDENTDESMWRWWPCFVGGFCGPLLAHVLVRWVAASLAVGLAFFIMWLVVGLIFSVSPPSTRWSLARWAGGGEVGAIIAAVLAMAFHA